LLKSLMLLLFDKSLGEKSGKYGKEVFCIEFELSVMRL
jgi:hypothetical protein